MPKRIRTFFNRSAQNAILLAERFGWIASSPDELSAYEVNSDSEHTK